MKMLINSKKQVNKELVSKANRLKFESEKIFAITKKAAEYVVPPKSAKPTSAREANIFAEFGTGPLNMTGADSTSKKKELYTRCACGDPNPTLKGHCIECVKKLKARFEKALSKFNKVKDEYDNYN